MRTLRVLAREVLGPWGGRTVLAFQFTEMVRQSKGRRAGQKGFEHSAVLAS